MVADHQADVIAFAAREDTAALSPQSDAGGSLNLSCPIDSDDPRDRRTNEPDADLSLRSPTDSPTRDSLALSRRGLIASVSALAAGYWVRCAPAVEVAKESPRALTAAREPLPAELWRASASRLATAIRDREVSSRQVVAAHLERIEAVNPQVNAVVRVLGGSALAAAELADAAVAAGRPLGPLHGVPFTIKENINVEGLPTTEGVPALADNIAAHDAVIVARLRAAGAIPIGRTNLPDFGMRVHTASTLYGLTRNPWNPSRNVGGSSGGEAAALATGMTPLGLGNDIGGSLRNPAHCCGITSLKPTFGRFPRAIGEGDLIASQLMAVDGPMARRITDLDLAYRLMAGPDPSDPWSMPVPLELQAPPSPIKVALVPNPPGGDTHPSIVGGVRKAGEVLAAAGYVVEEIDPPDLDRLLEVWGRFLATDFELVRPDMERMMGPDAKRFLQLGFRILKPGDRAVFSQMLAAREEIAAAWSKFQVRYPLIVGPVFTQPPFPVGYDIESARTAADALNQIRFTVAANLLGLPVVTLPVGIDDGLPLAVQIFGDRYRETLCLAAGATIEKRLGIITPIDPKLG